MSSTKKNNARSHHQAIIQQSQTLLIIHCDQRYDAIKEKIHLDPSNSSRTSEIQSRIISGNDSPPSDTAALKKMITHYLSYWQLQWDQHMFYQNGLLPAWIYESWLRQRYEDFNFLDGLETITPRTETESPDPDLASIKRDAESHQKIYREGWQKAKQFYSTKKGFPAYAHQLDRVMMPPHGMPPPVGMPIGTILGTNDPVQNDRLREMAIQELLKLGFMKRYENFFP